MLLQSSAPAIERLKRSSIPLFVAYAGYDPEQLKTFAAKLEKELCERDDRCPEYIMLKDHNHFTEGMAIGTRDQSLSGSLLDSITAHVGEPGPS